MPPPPPALADAPKDGADDAPPERAPDTFGTGDPNPELNDAIVEALQTVFDPEIPVDIYQMGLIYEVRVDTEGSAYVEMTLTSPTCPVAETLPGEVEVKVRGVEGVTEARVELVWEPIWTMEMISEAARLQLNL
ncbi:MAG: FeS assembly SUF system protein [Planctomycetes bacterium]|nr:FeS assembly SUF system protein [Planctomycetota bacterium]